MLKKVIAFFVAGSFGLFVNAQKLSVPPTTQSFGVIDTADLKMTSCDFEKDANAEVLFDKGSISFNYDNTLIFERHIRIKIFNTNGLDEANIKVAYFGGKGPGYMTGVEAETINLTGGAIEITKAAKKIIYRQKVSAYSDALVFAFPNAKPGSIIEYKYTLHQIPAEDFPVWRFQRNIPTRYSEINTDMPHDEYYKPIPNIRRPLVKNTINTKALANIPSVADEPFMSSAKDYQDRLTYQYDGPVARGKALLATNTWGKAGMGAAVYFGRFKQALSGEDQLLDSAMHLKTDTAKMIFIYNTVKDSMKWDGETERTADDSLTVVWGRKTGNSAEINYILYHLLKKAKINALPMLVSTRNNGKVNPAFPSVSQFNAMVVYFPVNDSVYYVLDASRKFNVYNLIPANLLNNYGLLLDGEHRKNDILFLTNTNPTTNITFINAEIKPDGSMSGTTNISSFTYNRINAIRKYKADGADAYIKSLQNNGLKITALKMDNMDIDSLPLKQSFSFYLSLPATDDSYIYFKPNLFSSDFDNAFLSETRLTDIDFGCLNKEAVNGLYKIPAGYKIDAMPKSISMEMPDSSIVFKRIVTARDGEIVVRYSLGLKKSIYPKADYPGFYSFFKKMNEMMNEQVVLKKI